MVRARECVPVEQTSILQSPASFRVAHTSRVLVLASRQNSLPACVGSLCVLLIKKSPGLRDAIANTRDECATRNGFETYVQVYLNFGLFWHV